MEFARQYPDRVRGLVLAATFAQQDTDEVKQKRNAMAARLLREGMAEYAEAVLPQMLAPRSIETLPAVAEHVSAMMHATNPKGAAAALLGRSERPSYEETLASLAVPALVVVGSEDAFTTRQDAEHMRDLLERSQLVWLDGIGHMPNLESPEAFNSALIQFLSLWGQLGRHASQYDPRRATGHPDTTRSTSSGVVIPAAISRRPSARSVGDPSSTMIRRNSDESRRSVTARRSSSVIVSTS